MEGYNLYLRPVTIEDAELLFRWRNDESARKNYFNSDELTFESHINWLKNTLSEGCVLFYILMRNSQAVGQVRLTPESGFLSVSYSIDSAYRGLGLGTAMLSKIECVVEEKYPSAVLIAEVKKENIASYRVFERLEYEKSIKADLIYFRKTITDYK